MPQPLCNRPASSITDAEAIEWVAQASSDPRIVTLAYDGRDAMDRPMIRLEAEGLTAGTYSIGRAIAMLSGSDKAPRRDAGFAPAPLPEDPHAGFRRKTSVAQLTDGELKRVAKLSLRHPCISPDDACKEVKRRLDAFMRMTPWDAERSARELALVARNDERVDAIVRDGQLDDGLPTLSGTLRQIAYAVEIRAAYAKAHPKDRALKAGKTAKYWIENHRDVLRRRA